MSLNLDVDGNGSPGRAGGSDAELRTTVAVAEPATLAAVQPAYELPPPPQARPWGAQVAVAPAQAPARRRPRWIVPTGIAIIGLIAAGSVGGFLYTTIGQRDTARHQLASTQATLTDTQKQLAARSATDAYVKLYVVNSGKVTTDYGYVIVCDSYLTCRTSAQDMLTDMKAFQAARSSAVLPAPLATPHPFLPASLTPPMPADPHLITRLH